DVFRLAETLAEGAEQMPPQDSPGRMRSAERQGLARPRSKKKRDQQLNLSLTEDEFAEAYWRARRVGMRMVDYGRWRLLGGDKQPVVPSNAATSGEHLFLAELKRLGNNLNQLVRICHTTRQPPPASLEALLERIRAAINRGMPR